MGEDRGGRFDGCTRKFDHSSCEFDYYFHNRKKAANMWYSITISTTLS